MGNEQPSPIATPAGSLETQARAVPTLGGATAFLCGAAITILRGCVGYARGAGATWGVDFAKLNSAGQHWLVGTNPYLDSAIGCADPTHASSFAAPLGLIPFKWTAISYLMAPHLANGGILLNRRGIGVINCLA